MEPEVIYICSWIYDKTLAKSKLTRHPSFRISATTSLPIFAKGDSPWLDVQLVSTLIQKAYVREIGSNPGYKILIDEIQFLCHNGQI